MKRLSFSILGVLMALALTVPAASRAETPNEVVEKSAITLQAFLEGQEGRVLRPLLDKAVAVIVLPEYIRGGIGIGGEGGTGVRAMTVKGGAADSVYVFARSKGAYAGAILKGGRIDLKQAWNVDSPGTASTDVLRSTGVRTESAQRLQRLLETR